MALKEGEELLCLTSHDFNTCQYNDSECENDAEYVVATAICGMGELRFYCYKHAIKAADFEPRAGEKHLGILELWENLT